MDFVVVHAGLCGNILNLLDVFSVIFKTEKKNERIQI